MNLPRIEVLWRPLTNHLLEVCQHPHIRMREWGVEAITYLVKAALQYKYETPLKDNVVRWKFWFEFLDKNQIFSYFTISKTDSSNIAFESIGRTVDRSAW